MKNETPPTVSLADVLAAVRDRRDNGGGSASYRQACNHLIEAVQLLRPAHTPAPDTRLPDALKALCKAIDIARDMVPDEEEGLAAEIFVKRLNRAQMEARRALRDITPHPAVEVTEKRARESDDLLDRLADDTSLELTYQGWDDEACWQVHRVNGGRNDREWTLIAEGDTPRETLSRAFAASASTTEDGV